MKTYCVQSLNESPGAGWERALDAQAVTAPQLAERLARAQANAHGGSGQLALLSAPVEHPQLLAALRARRTIRPRVGVVVVVCLAGLDGELGVWVDTLQGADLVLVERPSLAKAVEEQVGVTARVLAAPHPQRSAEVDASETRPHFTVVAPPGYGHWQLFRELGGVGYCAAALRKRLRLVSAASAARSPGRVAVDSSLVYVPHALDDGGCLAEACAHYGAVLVAESDYEAATWTHPHTTFREGDRSRVVRLLLWLLSDKATRQFLRTSARHSVSNLYDDNRRVQFLRQVQYARPDGFEPIQAKGCHGLLSQIHHCSGPEVVPKPARGCLAVCLQRNGSEYLQGFLDHHRALGVEHFVFVDNDSTDDSFERLKAQPDVTLYRTSLPHKYYECEIRRLLLEKHGRHRWCLNVDIDELFDFPHSQQLGLPGLIAHLQQTGATAMVAYLLDMFAKRTEFSDADRRDPTSQCAFFDISHLEQREYHHSDVAGYCGQNQLQDPCIRNYYGGIRQTVFGSKTGARYLLTKHPLLFLDGRLRPVTTPHFCDRATVADVTGVLYHYKFTPSFRQKVAESRQSERYVKFAQDQYDTYERHLSGCQQLVIDTPGAQRLTGIEQLVDAEFVKSSPALVARASRVNAVHRRAS